MNVGVRVAGRSDFALAATIEAAADVLLIEYLQAAEWPPVDEAEVRMAQPGFMLIAEDEASTAGIGFAHILEVDGYAHLEQLAVLPQHGRQGHGRRLVHAAAAHATARRHSEITLRTYLHVPWNAPFYETCGFRRSEPASPFHSRLVDVESCLGLERYGARIQMTLQL